MLVRIVKLSIEDQFIEAFLNNFENNKQKIRGFEGCQFLELYQEQHTKNVFFTYSYWDDEAALYTYRNSDLFRGIWAKTKPMFNAKPEAWSVNKLHSLD
ncbi:putative quinol monooxygenase [Aurantibacter aestuarii]|uniref:Antibiotic biosynthesis monooxygenase n=1 Tax=Aurantibacter aestuarii TaxID=1266046 RepID=A0A2T1NBC1_9FLAO|nr:antibiotic biosynthesis monooxygenase family protein [Aurantibacter aestuarii]PSG89444.1 antibiotic biosynthesis monooxygenase [Aurantibacter aestuarii]